MNKLPKKITRRKSSREMKRKIARIMVRKVSRKQETKRKNTMMKIRTRKVRRRRRKHWIKMEEIIRSKKTMRVRALILNLKTRITILKRKMNHSNPN